MTVFDKIKEMERDPSLSFWFKKALASGLDRDCIDAARDAGLLARVLGEVADHYLNAGRIDRFDAAQEAILFPHVDGGAHE